MPTEAKANVIEQTTEWYAKSLGVVFTDYRGLKMKELQGLRNDLRKKGAEFHVIKNTLFRRAAGDDAEKLPTEFHNGTTGFTFIFENEAEISKTLVDFARTSRKLIVKGGFFGGRPFTAKDVEALAELPPREVLIAQVIGAIAAPLTTLVGTIEALYADPIRTIGAVADKVAKESPAPAAAAPVAAEPAVAVEEVAAEPAAEAPAEEAAAPEAPAEEAPATAEEAAPEAPAAE